MKKRLDYYKTNPKAIKGLLDIERFIHSSSLDEKLLHLVKLRASQINGCGYCVDMHSKDADYKGETFQRLHGVAVWRETPYYTEKERAAFEWTEALTLVAENHIEDELYERVAAHFDDQELLALTMTIVNINSWNRMAKAFAVEVGNYDPEAGK